MMLQLRLARLASGPFNPPKSVAAERLSDLVFAFRLSPCNLRERVTGTHGRGRGVHELLRHAIDGWKVFIRFCTQTFASRTGDRRQLRWYWTILAVP